MKKRTLRILCVVLCMAVLFGLFPGGVSAELSGITGVVPTDEYTFFDFEDFKEMCQDALVFEETMTCVYTGYVDFVIESNVTIPQTVTLKTDGAGIRIPAGVTVTLEGKMQASDLQVEGKLVNSGRLDLIYTDGCVMYVSEPEGYDDGSVDPAGTIYIATQKTTLPQDCITGLNLSDFYAEEISEEDAHFWKLTRYQDVQPDPKPEPDPDPDDGTTTDPDPDDGTTTDPAPDDGTSTDPDPDDGTSTDPDPNQPSVTDKIEVTPMYRLYNPNSGEHFYTGSEEERDMLVLCGWQYEGVAWNAPVKSGDPVYRLFNPNSGDHHYTMSAEERDNLVGYGWKYEGVAWNSAPANRADATSLYRLYNPNADCGSHHYTGSEEERDYLVGLGWHYEGIGWFGIR